jgi:hypothetical protein
MNFGMSIISCISITHGRICGHKMSDYFFPLDPYFERFYLVGFKPKWRLANTFRGAG